MGNPTLLKCSSSTLEMSLPALCCSNKRSNCPCLLRHSLACYKLYLAEMGLRTGAFCVSIFEIQPLPCLVKRFHLCCNTTREQINCQRRLEEEIGVQSDSMVSRCENPDGWYMYDVIILLLPSVPRAVAGHWWASPRATDPS